MSKESVRILWAEDSISDILLIKEAFEQANFNPRLNIVNDGSQALDFLFRRGRYSLVSRPELIILDLNMPKKTGREVINEIKNEQKLSSIPVVVFTSSGHDQYVLDGCDPNRCLYLVKPTSFAALVEAVKKIQTFWLSFDNPNQET